MKHRFLALLFVLASLPSVLQSQEIRVAVYNDVGVSKGLDNLLDVLAKHPNLKVKQVKAADIRMGALREVDILLHPGGTGGGQGKALGDEGREAVRTFVQNGGGYVGICAGAYLATNDYPWSLHILDAKVIDKAHWARGFGDVQVTLTKKGRELLGVNDEKVTIYYHQGPLLAPANDPKIPDYETLGTFSSEIAKNGAPKGVMPGTTAIAVSTFGKGRVWCFSPHPERTDGLQGMVYRSVVWASAIQPKPKSEFLDQVRLHFPNWDADKDGKLSPNEIELAVANPKVKGQAAAAAAALRRAIRANREIQSFALPQIVDAVPYNPKATPKILNLESLYATYVERIQTAKRELFVSEMPKVECISQGKLGDCFLLASLGTVTARDPARLKKMFKELPEGKVEVAFGTGRKLVIDMPTDAEICIAARNQNDGMWAIVYEKAIGTVYLERQKSSRHVTPLSIIGVGGSPNVPLELLTGHAVKRTGCEDFQSGKLDAEAREKKLAEVRERLSEAVRKGRLIVGGTAPLGGKQTVVPGLYYNHSYGVLDFNEKTDEVTFWNPMGNRYTPKGPPSLKTGYVIEHGRFTMPLTDAVMWFGSFSIETDEKSTRFAE